MKAKHFTHQATANIQQTSAYIAADNEAAALRFQNACRDTFLSLPDTLLPRRASQRLPAHVRTLNVRGFRGYTLRIAVFEDAVYLLNAFAPGLSEAAKNRSSRRALGELD